MPELAQSGLPTRDFTLENSSFPVLLTHYQIHGIIGEGGMGTVFKALHLHLKRFVAIKTLRIDQRRSADLIGRFKQEMELVGQMDHPNVVRATDAGEKNGIFYLVMEYLPGSDLSRLVNKKERLDVAFACELASQAALGLDYIHQKTLVHRDIKPSNLLLTTSGLVKILDLGLARFGFNETDHHEHTPAGQAVGTYSYMAPEQATAGGAVDGRADIYSLGCSLFKLLTGKTPYSGPEYDNAAKVLYAHCNVPLASVDGFELISENLRGVLVKMTAKNPAQRYQTGRDVAEALAPFFDSGSVHALQPHVLERARGEVAETPVRPLTDPLPEELTRLTDSVQLTPQNTPAAATSAGGAIAVKPAAVWPRWLAGVGILAVVVGLAAWLLVPLLLVPHRDPEPKKNLDKQPDENKPLPELVRLPVKGASVRDLDALEPGEFHELLKLRAFPPALIGFERDDTLASAHWFPGVQKLELTPTSTVLVQLGSTSKKEPGFTLQTFINQQLWHQNVGLFWGYLEDGRTKDESKPGVKFASCQVLQLKHKVDEITKAKIFMIQRSRIDLGYTADRRIAILFEKEIASHDMPALNLGSEQSFSIEVKDGRLTQAMFGGISLRKVYYGGALATFGPNGNFTPSDYKGSFGLFSAGAAVTFRNTAVMMHKNK